MPAYLVRTIEERDLVGVFYAADVHELAYMLDEVLEPNYCEYTTIGPGGVIWEEPAIAIPVPKPKGDDDDNSEGIPWKDARFTENWAMLVYNKGGKRWRKINVTVEDLYGIDPETPDPDPPPRPKSQRAGTVLPFRRRNQPK
ncbi:hypothetical protein [Bradyrhizobium genomosp. III]|uniref:hypothetical protein n=1 Tax=Bradyrhizobium genomosp. III TaxID=2683271 RepID=UPI000577EAA3|nr:hypothetical protein [Bradyrhizobium sp. CCBAU 15544]